MRANLDFVQRAIVLHIAVVGTLADGTFNRLVSMCVHVAGPPFLVCRNSMPLSAQDMNEKDTRQLTWCQDQSGT